ncbi:hypothetical protein ERHA55_08740 [Erwinia rhapontici]|nr:hypothetical protein ERHA55_08740 [Erwinia rhapontici]
MKVKKSLNNSMLLVQRDQSELILFGKGIGFGAKPGADVDRDAIEQVFIPLEGVKTQHFLSLTDTVPAAYFDLTHDIIALAQKQYVEKLNNVLFFTLAEHLFYAVERCKAGNPLANKLNWEVKRYYPREYQIGVQARDLANDRFRVVLDDDEAVHIAFHLINASGDPDSGMRISRFS